MQTLGSEKAGIVSIYHAIETSFLFFLPLTCPSCKRKQKNLFSTILFCHEQPVPKTNVVGGVT